MANEKDKVLSLVVDALCVDGGHHKQWYLEEIAKVLLKEKHEGWKQYWEKEGWWWEEGIAP